MSGIQTLDLYCLAGPTLLPWMHSKIWRVAELSCSQLSAVFWWKCWHVHGCGSMDEKAEILTIWWMFSVTSASVAASKSRNILLKILKFLTYLYFFLNFKFLLYVSLQPVAIANDSVCYKFVLVAIISAFWAIYLNALDILHFRISPWNH